MREDGQGAPSPVAGGAAEHTGSPSRPRVKFSEGEHADREDRPRANRKVKRSLSTFLGPDAWAPEAEGAASDDEPVDAHAGLVRSPEPDESASVRLSSIGDSIALLESERQSRAKLAVDTIDDIVKMHSTRSNKRSSLIMRVLRQVTEAKEETFLRRLVESPKFQLAVLLLIGINTVYIAVETDHNKTSLGEFNFWLVCELLFAFLFTAEIVLRIAGLGSQFLGDVYNVFDLFVVVVTVVDASFEVANALSAGDQNAGSGISGFRVLRFLRYLRILRMLRLLHIRQELMLLVSGVLTSMRSLVWVLVMMVCLVFLFSLMTTRIIGQPHGCGSGLVRDGASCDDKVWEWLGTVPRSMLTFTQIIFFEDWHLVARKAGKFVPLSQTIFIAFLVITNYAILNVVIAVMVQITLEQTPSSDEQLLRKMKKDQRAAEDRLLQVFDLCDRDGDGTLTKDEFVGALMTPEVKGLFAAVKIDMRGAEGLFDTLDYDDSGALDRREFVEGCMRARGEAKSKDVLAMQCDIWRTQKAVSTHWVEVENLAQKHFGSIQQTLQPLREQLARNGHLHKVGRPATSSGVCSSPRSAKSDDNSASCLDISQRDAVE